MFKGGRKLKMESVNIQLLRAKFKGGCCCICPLLVESRAERVRHIHSRESRPLQISECTIWAQRTIRIKTMRLIYYSYLYKTQVKLVLKIY